jgi:RND family efflux transporter MFP subunit
VIHLVTKSEDFTGRTEPYRYVDIKPQVTGELKGVHFEDGDNVRKGQRLFTIDDRIYKAQRDSAKAQVALSEAKLERYEADLERVDSAYKKGVMAKADYDAAKADRDGGKASVEDAKAKLALAEQNLEWTQIPAQYSGRLSMRRVDPGNIVTANTTVMTTLIVLDPMYIGFDIDEQTVERRREAIKAGEIPSSKDEPLKIEMGLGHQEGYQYTAKVTFSDNQLDPGTGTLHIRAEMENPSLRESPLAALVGQATALDVEQKGMRLLSPNMFVRVRLPLGRPYQALLIREEALGSDQGHKYVYIVNDKNEIEYRRVKLGPTFKVETPEGTHIYRAVNERAATPRPQRKNDKIEGITRTDRVVIAGQQRIRENDVVNPELVPNDKIEN